MPPLERFARIADQRARLVGMDLLGSLEVAHCVYDLFVGIMESDQLRYVHPSKCITRSQEVAASKPPKEIKLDSSSSALVVKEQVLDKDCNMHSELEVLQAMTRRSLAMDCVGLMTYATAQKWVTTLFNVLQQQPPPGFIRVSLTQLLRTDRQAFIKMSETCLNGIRPTPDGVRPLDAAMANVCNDSTVMFYMLPTLAPKEVAEPKKRKHEEAARSPGSAVKPANIWSANKKGGKGSKGKGKFSNSGKLPERLKGCAATNDQDERLCFAYNLDGCDRAGPGERCDRGRRQCCRKGCFKNHPQHAHPGS